MKKAVKNKKEIVIYQAKSGAIELKGDFEHETLWANINQIADIFGVQKAAISKHLKNIFESGELSRKATVSILETVQTEGGRSVKRSIETYNLDAVIAVGYRVNSKQATQFRIWSTKILKEYVRNGYVLNRKRIAENYDKFSEAIENIRGLLPKNASVDTASVLELISAFADTWLSLDAYDKDELVTAGASKQAVSITADQLVDALASFRSELLKKKEATEIFGQERQRGSVAGIVGNVMQSFGGKPLYPTVEEKAAHLFYFMVKNHPLVDGNKRSGAYAFVWFLKKAGLLDLTRITPPALTALTLFIAESNPKHKDKMVRLVLQLLKK